MFETKYVKTKNEIYTFEVHNQKDFFFKPEFNQLQVIRYYQICKYKNNNNYRYHVREFIINQNNDFVDIRTLYLTDKQVNKLIVTESSKQYKIYDTDSLQCINYPIYTDIFL